MAPVKITRLKETHGEMRANARVIDADYEIVGGGDRSFMGRVKVALLAALCAALVGVMVPPLVVAAVALSKL